MHEEEPTLECVTHEDEAYSCHTDCSPIDCSPDD